MHDLGSAQKLPARPQTVTPGSTRGLTSKTVIARRDHSDAIHIQLGRSHAQTQTGRGRWRLCPLVHRNQSTTLEIAPVASGQGAAILEIASAPAGLSLGEAWPCEPLVSNLGNLVRPHGSGSGTLYIALALRVGRIETFAALPASDQGAAIPKTVQPASNLCHDADMKI